MTSPTKMRRSPTKQAAEDWEKFINDPKGSKVFQDNIKVKNVSMEEGKKRFIEEKRYGYYQSGKSLKITPDLALKMAKKFNINLKVVPIMELQKGIEIELEHGKMLGKLTNITKDDIEMTTRIAIAHLIEDPRYYKYLIIMEKKREKYWKNKEKPSIFN